MSPRQRYKNPAVAVDIAVFTIREEDLQVLLIRRRNAPFQGAWALPGGFVNYDESLDDAARRELKEETHVDGASLRQFHSFGAPKRDPRMRVISVAYFALVRADQVQAQAGDDAREARWFSMRQRPRLAFDHRDMLQRALQALRRYVRDDGAIADPLSRRSSLAELRRLRRIILGKKKRARELKEKKLRRGVVKRSGNSTRSVSAASK